MGFIKRKNKKFEYKPRYYKGEGNPYEISHKFDKFRPTSSSNKGLKAKFVNAIDEIKGNKKSIEVNDEVYEVNDNNNSTRIVMYIIAVLLLIFLFIIDFDLSIFYSN